MAASGDGTAGRNRDPNAEPAPAPRRYNPGMRVPALLSTLLLPALAPAQDLVWHTDFGKARALARAEQRPMLLLFRCER